MSLTILFFLFGFDFIHFNPPEIYLHMYLFHEKVVYVSISRENNYLTISSQL